MTKTGNFLRKEFLVNFQYQADGDELILGE